MIAHSFTAWQINENINGLLSENYKGISFNKYIKQLGLGQKEEILDPTLLAKKNIELAEKIKSYDTLRGDTVAT